MNVWLAAATVLCVTGVLPGLLASCRGDAMARLLGLQLMTVSTILVLMLVAHGFSRAIYFDVALVLAVLSLASGLVFTRFLGRSL